MKFPNKPKFLKFLIPVIGVSLIGLGYLFLYYKKDADLSARQPPPNHLSNLPLLIAEGSEIELNPEQLTIYTRDQWCETSSTLFGIGLSWDDLIEALLISLGTLHENEERELSIYFLGVTSDEGVKMAEYITSEADALGYRLAGKELLDYRITDYYKPLRSVLSTHPDVLIIFNPYPTGDILLEQIAKLQVTSDMAVASFNEAIDLETVKRIGKGLAGFKIAGSRNKQTIVAAVKTALNDALAADPEHGKQMSSEDLSKKLLSLRFASPFGELAFSPENFLLEQPIEIMEWDGEKFTEAEDSGFARHRGSCPKPAPTEGK